MMFTGSCSFSPSQRVILRVVDPKILIDLDISATVKGNISYNVTDPDMLKKAFGFDVNDASSRTRLEAGICDTVLNVLHSQAAKLSLDGISPEALKSKNFGLSEGIRNTFADLFVSSCGAEITGFELTDITYDEDDMNMLDSCIYRYNSMVDANNIIKRMKEENTMAAKEKALDDVLAQTQEILKFFSNKKI